MVAANQIMNRADVLAVVQTLANSKITLPHKPFAVHSGPINDRGGFVFGNTYNTGDQVAWMGYLFIASASGVTAPPLDAITRNPAAGWSQPWYSCYQRVRDSLHEAVNDVETGIELWKQSVSGPWPCQTPDVNYNHVEFYFADTGRGESVTLGGSSPSIIGGGPAQANGKFELRETGLWFGPGTGAGFLTGMAPQVESGSPEAGSTYRLTAVTGPEDPTSHGGQFRLEYNHGTVFQVAIGGTQPLNINATFDILVEATRGASLREFAHHDPSGDFVDLVVSPHADTDPSALVSVDAGNFLPGATFTPAFSGWANINSGGNLVDQNIYTGTIRLSCVINGTFDPGIYSVTVQSGATVNNRASGTLEFVFPADGSPPSISGENVWEHDTFVNIGTFMTIVGTCGLVSTNAVEVPGVHDSKRVFKIVAPVFNPLTDLPTGLWCGQSLYKFATPNPNHGTLDNPFAGWSPVGYIPETGNPDPVVFVRNTFNNRFGLAYSASTTGFWFAVTPPPQSLGLCPWEKMPWNIFPVTVVGTPGTAVVNQYLGYAAPYLYGPFVTGIDAMRAYAAGDGPPWAPFLDANEALPWPKRWKPLVHYPQSYRIMDANGNLQIVDKEGRSGTTEPAWPSASGDTITEPDYHSVNTDTGVRWKLYKVLKRGGTIKRNTDYALNEVHFDDNGNRQTVTVAGTSAATAPTWNKASLGLTVDGGVTWQLIRFGALQPAIAHLTPPIYPIFWQNPTAGQSDTPPILTNPVVDARGNRPYDFAPQGWWIYRVALNRIPQEKTTEKPSAEAIAVKIGCIRNGAFVSFGTYNTGQIINAYWPVFTNTALCYQAAERVDIQAAIITCGTGYVLWGEVDFPFAATYLNDVEVLLGKIQ